MNVGICLELYNFQKQYHASFLSWKNIWCSFFLLSIVLVQACITHKEENHSMYHRRDLKRIEAAQGLGFMTCRDGVTALQFGSLGPMMSPQIKAKSATHSLSTIMQHRRPHTRKPTCIFRVISNYSSQPIFQWTLTPICKGPHLKVPALHLRI